MIDDDPSILAIDDALAGLEAEALASGSALGAAQGYPVSLERLRLWATTLDDKGLVLAPVSALVIERSGLAAGFETMARSPASPAADAAGPQPGYRPCVGLMLLNPANLLLIGERRGPLLEAWQMPQGALPAAENCTEERERAILPTTMPSHNDPPNPSRPANVR